MVVLIRCNDIESDPRAMKYVSFLRDNGIEYKLIGWDRDQSNPPLDNSVFFKRRAQYNVGGFVAVKNRVLWMKFVYRQLKQFGSKGISIHGCDLDSAFPAACYKLLHPSCNLIFDVFDWFSANLYDQRKYILMAFKIMERFTVKMSDYIIICEKERIEQIPFKVKASMINVLPNIPLFKDNSFLVKDKSLGFNNNKLTFSYVGGFSEGRCLFELLSIAKKGIINLLIAGYGNSKLEMELESATEKYDNIHYFGKVDYQKGLNISYNSDIMYAMYSPNNPNNVYAAPNKYYESMFLGKPIFTSKGTIVEKKVVNHKMGFVSADNEFDILNTIERINRDELDVKGKNSRECWETTYKNYTQNFLISDYLKMIDIKDDGNKFFYLIKNPINIDHVNIQR